MDHRRPGNYSNYTWDIPQNQVYQQGPERRSLSPIPRTGRLFISGLGYDISNSALKDYFQQFGGIKWTQAYPARGVGYVAFSDPERMRAVLARSNHLLFGRHMKVELVTDEHEYEIGLASPGTNPRNRSVFNQRTEQQQQAFTPEPNVNVRRGFLGELETDFDWTPPEFEPSPPGEVEVKIESHPWLRTAGSTRDIQYHVNPPPVPQQPPMPPPEVRPPLPPLPRERYLPDYDDYEMPQAQSEPTLSQYGGHYSHGNDWNHSGWNWNTVASALPELPETQASSMETQASNMEAPLQFIPPPFSFRDDEADPEPEPERPPPPQRYLNWNSNAPTSSSRDSEATNRVSRTFVHENTAAAYGRFNNYK